MGGGNVNEMGQVQSDRRKKGAYSGSFFQVWMTGLEPATSWSLTRCATNCATSRGFGIAKVQFFYELANKNKAFLHYHPLNVRRLVLICNFCKVPAGFSKDECGFLAHGYGAVVPAQSHGVSAVQGDGIEGFNGRETHLRKGRSRGCSPKPALLQGLPL